MTVIAATVAPAFRSDVSLLGSTAETARAADAPHIRDRGRCREGQLLRNPERPREQIAGNETEDQAGHRDQRRGGSEIDDLRKGDLRSQQGNAHAQDHPAAESEAWLIGAIGPAAGQQHPQDQPDQHGREYREAGDERGGDSQEARHDQPWQERDDQGDS